MSDHPSDSASKRTQGVGFHFLVLTVALWGVFPVFAWFGHQRHEADGFWAAVVSAAVCWAGASAALLLIGISRGTSAAVHSTLLATLFRMAPPLLVGITLQQAGGQLARAGVFGMILCYYFWTLLVETLLSVRLLSESRHTVAKV